MLCEKSIQYSNQDKPAMGNIEQMFLSLIRIASGTFLRSSKIQFWKLAWRWLFERLAGSAVHAH